MRDVRPQPAFLALDAADFASPVLDIGSGEGDLAMHIAALGYDVLGIDVDARAVATARARAAHSRARFSQLDVLDAVRLGRRFACVVDSGLLHTLDPPARERLVRALSALVQPGGAYHVLGYADRLDRHALSGWFRLGWRVEAIRSARYVPRWNPEGVAAVLATLRRDG